MLATHCLVLLIKIFCSCIVAQSVSRMLLTAKVRVQFPANTCGGRSGTGLGIRVGFLQFPPVSKISTLRRIHPVIYLARKTE